jgi:uncharacterized protein (TIGR00645 family)
LNFERALVASRFIIVIPVVVLGFSALAAFGYATRIFFHSVHEVFQQPFPIGNKVAIFILDIDLFLIGATLLIAALGFYELFIARLEEQGGKRHLPRWLAMEDLNDLKARVIAMIVLVAAISFVEVVVDLRSGLYILEFGGGVAAVIIALAVFLRLSRSHAED